jgi:hypothetical protein
MLRRHLTISVAIAAFGLALTAGAAPAAPATFPSLAHLTGGLDAAGLSRVAHLRWHRFGIAPTVRVSPAYGDSAAIAQRWSSFFQSLLHGSELNLLDAYVAPLDEVRQLCGSSDVLGCYGENHLVIPDRGEGGIPATSIATHEYGHHVAFNRVNPPWVAVDWGTKRWETYERICARVAAGTAFPGAEDANYPLNPGEAFAETYRVLNETAAGLSATWPIVDPSFRPDGAALDAVRRDVLDPWTAPTVTVRRVAFARNSRNWSMRIATPLDGSVRVQVEPGNDDVTLLAADARTVVGRGAWTSSGAKSFSSTACGQRSFVLRVTRHSPGRRFTLRLSAP